MDGDNKPDLVVTGIGIGSGSHFQFDVGVNPYWKVYLNTGSGMSSTAINWVTPIGGYYSGSVNYGYNTTNGNSGGNNSESWSLTDMDGDNKPDLVVTSIGIGSGSHQQFGVGASPFWKVYFNTGVGMSTTVLNWSTPLGGYFSGTTNYGYNDIYGSAGGNNSESWALADMDGDNKPELIVSSIGTGSGSHFQFGVGASPYWKVHFNNGSGMSSTAVNWSTPIGGYYSGSTNYGYNDIFGNSGGNNSESWEITDMNGDNEPDLVVTSVGVGSGSHFQFDVGVNPYWKVYLNVGITGIVANQKENFPISIYPNPCIDNFTLETNAVSVGTIFSIVDVLGKKLFDLQITNSKCYVDFRNAKSGIYFLQTNNNSIKAQKIIKQ